MQSDTRSTTVKKKRINIAWLPAEILRQIFFHLTTFDIDLIPLVCKSFRMALKNDSVFGKQFLLQKARDLSFLIQIEIAISSLDRFDIAMNTSGQLVFHHAKFSQSDIYTFTLDLLGRTRCTKSKRMLLPPCISASQYFENSASYLIPIWNARHFGNRNDSVILDDAHRLKCRLCKTLQLASIGYMVDKSYRVFFQSWNDTLDFVFPNGIHVKLQISHRDDGVDISFNAPILTPPRIKSFRYDLLQTDEDVFRLEKFCKLTNMVATSVFHFVIQ